MKLTKTTFSLGCLVGGMGAALLPIFITASQAETKLLPFQGRLTDAGGIPVIDGAKVVEFKMYDAPTGGSVKWAGEVQKLSINGGLVSTMLGTKSGLGGVDFSKLTFLQITVDSNDDGQITAADPPLLPRQSILPSVFAVEAGNARKLAGHDWSSILVGGSNDPGTGEIQPSKIKLNGITAAQLATASVNADEI